MSKPPVGARPRPDKRAELAGTLPSFRPHARGKAAILETAVNANGARAQRRRGEASGWRRVYSLSSLLSALPFSRLCGSAPLRLCVKPELRSSATKGRKEHREAEVEMTEVETISPRPVLLPEAWLCALCALSRPSHFGIRVHSVPRRRSPCHRCARPAWSCSSAHRLAVPIAGTQPKKVRYGSPFASRWRSSASSSAW